MDLICPKELSLYYRESCSKTERPASYKKFPGYYTEKDNDKGKGKIVAARAMEA